MTEKHNIPPVFDQNSSVLILGSFPSVKSREQGFFYAHPQNRFWQVLAAVTNCEVPCSVDEKKAFLIKNRIALWDSVSSCDIIGSSDSSMKNVLPNDLNLILSSSPIRKIFLNGKTSAKYFYKYFDRLDIPSAVMPSTSPANAAFSLSALADKWREVGEILRLA